MTIPVFYDDFTDGKILQRTGKDPWARPLPEWNSVNYADERIITDSNWITSQYTGTNGYLFKVPGLTYCEIRANLNTPSTSSSWKVEFDYKAYQVPWDAQTGIRFHVAPTTGSEYYLTFSQDGHCWMGFGSYSMLGWNAPIQAPSGSNANYFGNKWIHVEWYKLPTHEMVILFNGRPLNYAWTDYTGSPLLIGTPDSGAPEGNTELWDNPTLYNPSVSYSNTFSGIKRVGVYFVYTDVVITNIKVWDDIEHYTFPKNYFLQPELVRIYGIGGKNVKAIRQSDGYYICTNSQNGWYQLHNLPLGTYDVTAFDGTNYASTTVSATSPGSYQRNFTLTSGYTPSTQLITGFVKDIYNNPINNAFIRIDGTQTYSDTNGNYTLSDIEEGRHTLVISKYPYEANSYIIDIIKEQPKIFNILLETSCPQPICDINLTQI